MESKSTLDIDDKDLALQMQHKTTDQETFRCITQETRNVDRSITTSQRMVITGFRNVNCSASLQESGGEIFLHIRLYTDSKESLPVGGR